jgi:hypothetical protein
MYAGTSRHGMPCSRVCAGDATEREDKRDENRACRDCVGEECQSYVRPGKAFSHDAGTYHSGDEEEGSYKLSGYSSL